MILNHVVDGRGRPILLLHPVGLDLSFLQPLAEELATRYRVMRMDLRGHGESATIPLAQGLDDYADDVHETLAAVGFPPCAVVGFSFGGMVAQTLALRHPSDVDALVVGACQSTHSDESRRVAAGRAVEAEQGGMAAVLEATLARWFTPAFRASGADAATRRRLLTDDPLGWAQGWRAISDLETLPMLPALRVPTLCIAGELDQPAPPSMLATIANAIPGARLTVIAGAPHMLFIEQPHAVAEALIDFLG
jgi:3-oxoadipate enol-lactonase